MLDLQGLQLLLAQARREPPGEGRPGAPGIAQLLSRTEAVEEAASGASGWTRGIRFAIRNRKGHGTRPGESPMHLGEKDRTPYESDEGEKEDTPSDPKPAPMRHEPRREMILRAPIRLCGGEAGSSPARASSPGPRT